MTGGTKRDSTRRMLRADTGATAVEYATIAAAIAAIIAGAAITVGTQVLGMFSALLAAWTS